MSHSTRVQLEKNYWESALPHYNVDPKVELGPPGLTASTFTCWASSLVSSTSLGSVHICYTHWSCRRNNRHWHYLLEAQQAGRKMGMKKLTSGTGEMGQSLRVFVASQGCKVHFQAHISRSSQLPKSSPKGSEPSSVLHGHLYTQTHKINAKKTINY